LNLSYFGITNARRQDLFSDRALRGHIASDQSASRLKILW